jgi:hypothetical protein
MHAAWSRASPAACDPPNPVISTYPLHATVPAAVRVHVGHLFWTRTACGTLTRITAPCPRLCFPRALRLIYDDTAQGDEFNQSYSYCTSYQYTVLAILIYVRAVKGIENEKRMGTSWHHKHLSGSQQRRT